MTFQGQMTAAGRSARVRAADLARRAARAVDHRLPPPPEAVLEQFSALPDAVVEDVVVERFNKIYYDKGDQRVGTWWDTHWLGTPIWKCPLDVWMYQEIITRIRPDLIIETGTAFGGSAAYLGAVCDLVDNGEIVSIDIDPKPDLPAHPRVTYVTSSSTAPDVVSEVSKRAAEARAVLVILDSDHSEAHVSAELAAYAPMVSVGSYVIVEDTNVNGHPALPGWGPGPWEAVSRFLPDHPEFVVDPLDQKFLLTFNPRGILRRTR